MKIINQQGLPISMYIDFASCGAYKPDEVLQERLLKNVGFVYKV
jgi:hypothetical protein